MDGGLDPERANPELLRGVRTLHIAWVVFAALAIPFVVIDWLFVSTSAALLLLAALAVGTANLVALRRFHCVYACGQADVVTLYLLLVGFTAYIGGDFRQALAWLYLVPVAATLFLGVRAGWWWAAVAGTTVCAFMILHRVGVRVPWEMGRPMPPFFEIASWMLPVFTATGLVSAFARGQRQLEESLRRSHERVRHLALSDSLTGLANRQHFQHQLERALESAARHDRLVGLLFIDLDGFKAVNDSLGHEAGDRVLQAAARRLAATLRLSDAIGRPTPDAPATTPEESIVALSRLGGDEFTVLLTEISRPDGAAAAAQRILEALQRPIDAGGCEVFARASIGIAIFPRDARTADQLLRCADVALYDAKERGKNGYQFFSADLNRVVEARVRMEARLRQALDEGRFDVHYQPIFDAAGRVLAAEALVRWTDPELGAVSPADFVAVAEQAGLIGRLGLWVLRRVCAQIADWQAQGKRLVRVAVNVSGRQVRQSGLAEQVANTLRAHGVSADLVGLEITESTLMSDDSVTEATLAALNALGVSIALDDFGTGFSSLSHLRRYPIDLLKIDRSFVAALPSSVNDRAIVVASISLAHHLGKRVVAEGVETEAQLEFLRAHQCDQFQGWLFSRAVPAAEFALFLDREEDA